MNFLLLETSDDILQEDDNKVILDEPALSTNVTGSMMGMGM